MMKGQHLRLILDLSGFGGSNKEFFALCTDFTFHLSASTEDSTTKDTTDTNGNYNEYDVVSRSGDMQLGSLLAYEEGTSMTAIDFNWLLDNVGDTAFPWKLVMVDGAMNRVVGKTVCSGQCKITNLQATAQVNQKGTHNVTMNTYGPIVVGND